MTREFAAKWARRGIRVNAIAPGFFPSRMTEKVLAVSQPQMESAIPMGRVGAEGELEGSGGFPRLCRVRLHYRSHHCRRRRWNDYILGATRS